MGKWVQIKCCKKLNRHTHMHSDSEAHNPSDSEHDLRWSWVKSKHTNSHSLHGPLAGLGLLGPGAKEYTHWEDEHQETRSGSRGHQRETTISRLIPGGILCGADQSDKKLKMHHTKVWAFHLQAKFLKATSCQRRRVSICSSESCTQHWCSRSLPFTILKTDLLSSWYA